MSNVFCLFSAHRIVFFTDSISLVFQSNPADSVRELFSAQSLTAHLHTRQSVCSVPLSGHTLQRGFDHSDSCVSLRPNSTHTHTFPQETAITRSGTVIRALPSLSAVSCDARVDEMQEEGRLNLDTTWLSLSDFYFWARNVAYLQAIYGLDTWELSTKCSRAVGTLSASTFGFYSCFLSK